MRTLRGERGLAPALLVVIIAWALAAVLMLTGTILSAQRIERDVRGSIMGSTSAIDNDLDSVRLAAKTTRISGNILTAAEPLVGQLDQVIVSARSIDRQANSILDTAQSINGKAVAINATAGRINQTAGAINQTAGQINATAGSINANVTSILRRAQGIESTAGSINAKARSINGQVNGIAGSVNSINGRLGGTLDQVQSADPGIAGINIRANRAIRLVRPIRTDLNNILDEVGRPPSATGHRQRGGAGDLSVHGHANSIDCEVQALRNLPPVLTTGSPPGSSYCNR